MPLELSQQFFKTIGATGQEHPRVLGMMHTDEVMTEISDMTIANKPVTLIQKRKRALPGPHLSLGGRHGKDTNGSRYRSTVG